MENNSHATAIQNQRENKGKTTNGYSNQQVKNYSEQADNTLFTLAYIIEEDGGLKNWSLGGEFYNLVNSALGHLIDRRAWREYSCSRDCKGSDDDALDWADRLYILFFYFLP